jgi:hypothetical protein
MGNRFSSGKNAIAECDRCGFRFKLHELRKEIIKTKNYNLLVCNICWDPDQPQLQLGMYPVDDPQGVRDPRPDLSYYQSGNTGLQIVLTNSSAKDAAGLPSEGSRVFQWNWNPVGGSRVFDASLTPNYLVLAAEVGTVTVTIGV